MEIRKLCNLLKLHLDSSNFIVGQISRNSRLFSGGYVSTVGGDEGMTFQDLY
jgi:hypothetical protein